MDDLRNDPYYRRFSNLVSRPWTPDPHHYTLLETAKNSRQNKEIVEEIAAMVYSEVPGDRCLEALQGTGEHNERCHITESCIDYLLGRNDIRGYHLTHQVLYIMIGKEVSRLRVFLIAEGYLNLCTLVNLSQKDGLITP